MVTTNPSLAYQHFLDFFNLSQKERLDGLDASYFVDMTSEERQKAFEYLTHKFEFSVERIRGLYLCNSDKAIDLFKQTLEKEIQKMPSERKDEAALMGRIMICGYICNAEPNKENIDRLASFDIFSSSGEIRNALYKLLPSKPTTEKSISLLKKAVFFEQDKLTASSSIRKLMSTYHLLFDVNDKNYKNIYQNLRSRDEELKKSTIKKLEKLYTPIYAE